MPTIREIVTGRGEVRYRFVADLGSRHGRRRQVTRSFRSREAAERALVALQKVRDAQRAKVGAPVTDLFLAGACHPMCVFAWGTEMDGCSCSCGGRYHGKLSGLSCDWVLADPPRRPNRPRRPRAANAPPELRSRVVALHEEAMSLHPHRYRPAAYVVERLAAEGVAVSPRQVNNWIAYARRKSR